jgi:hypothetical protein
MLVSTASSSIPSLRITRCFSLYNTCYLVHSAHKMTFYIKMDKHKPQGFFQCPNHVETRAYTLNAYGFLDFSCALCWSSTDVSANITVSILSVNVCKCFPKLSRDINCQTTWSKPKCVFMHYLTCITEVSNCHSSKEASRPYKKKERIPVKLRPGAFVSIFLINFSAELFW